MVKDKRTIEISMIMVIFVLIYFNCSYFFKFPETITNLMISILSSTLLVLFLSIKDYYYTKRDLLEYFWIENTEIYRKYAQINDNEKFDERIKGIYELMEYDYKNFYDIYAKLIRGLIKKKSKLYFNLQNIYKVVRENDSFMSNKKRHFEYYKNKEIDEKNIDVFIKEIHSRFNFYDVRKEFDKLYRLNSYLNVLIYKRKPEDLSPSNKFNVVFLSDNYQEYIDHELNNNYFSNKELKENNPIIDKVIANVNIIREKIKKEFNDIELYKLHRIFVISKTNNVIIEFGKEIEEKELDIISVRTDNLLEINLKNIGRFKRKYNRVIYTKE